MTLKDDLELAATREKLREVEDRYESRLRESPSNPHVHELTLRSLKGVINQLKEEIARYEAHRPARRLGA